MSRNYDQAKAIEENEPDEKHLEIAFAKLVNELGEVGLSEDVGLVEATFRALDNYDELSNEVEELREENSELRDRLDALGDIGEEKTGKPQKIAAIVTYAQNARQDGQDAVTVLPKVIKGVADVSRRYAYDLVDDMIEQYDWAHDPSEVSQYGSMEKDTPQKGVLIDFEGVHGEPVSVNKFTTRSAGQGVAD